MRVSLERAQQLALDSLRALGYSGQDCRTIASHLMDCELRGLEYAGLARMHAARNCGSSYGCLCANSSCKAPEHSGKVFSVSRTSASSHSLPCQR